MSGVFRPVFVILLCVFYVMGFVCHVAEVDLRGVGWRVGRIAISSARDLRGSLFGLLWVRDSCTCVLCCGVFGILFTKPPGWQGENP